MQATWTLPNGTQLTADVPEGTNLMAAAVARNVPMITGECGGNLSCATCHVQVDAGWQAVAGLPGPFEDAMLDATEAARTPASRLSCQIRMTAALDGIVLHIPAA
jgi:ferredoxin, 2Fe-2S